MQIIPLRQDDLLRMKKTHPCGGRIFRVLRVGNPMLLCCEECGRNMEIDRIKLEKAIAQVLTDKPTPGKQEGAH